MKVIQQIAYKLAWVANIDMSIMVVVEDQGVLNHRFAKKLSSEQIHCPTLRTTIVTSISLPHT